jgi:hypothetical protein
VNDRKYRRELAALGKRHGLTLLDTLSGGGHYVLLHPSGRKVYASVSPGSIDHHLS